MVKYSSLLKVTSKADGRMKEVVDIGYACTYARCNCKKERGLAELRSVLGSIDCLRQERLKNGW